MFKCNNCNRTFETKAGLSIHKLHENGNYDSAGKKISKQLTGKKLPSETKLKISKSMKKYLSSNPNRVPYLLNHSSNFSYPEEILMNALKNENINNWIPRYRNGIYEYDIAFPIIKLDIEVDGDTHNLEKVKKIDIERDKWSYDNGWDVLRFTTDQIRNNLDIVILTIKQRVELSIFDIQEYYNEFDYDYLKKELNNKKQKKQVKIDTIKNAIINSNINFSKHGWVKETAKIIGISEQKVTYWMRKNMYDFWNEKCFKRKGTKK